MNAVLSGGGGGRVCDVVPDYLKEAPGVGELLTLPGDLVNWEPKTYQAKSAAILAETNPGAIRKLSRDLAPLDAGAVLLKSGDVFLLRGDLTNASAAYQHAKHAVENRVSRKARPFELAALYGLALVTVGRGDPWGALGYADQAMKLEGVDLAPVRALGETIVAMSY